MSAINHWSAGTSSALEFAVQACHVANVTVEDTLLTVLAKLKDLGAMFQGRAVSRCVADMIMSVRTILNDDTVVHGLRPGDAPKECRHGPDLC